MPGQVVDTLVAEEFREEVRKRISDDELRVIGGQLRGKAERFRDLLERGEAARRTPYEIRGLLRPMFGVRRRADAILAGVGDRLPAEVDLLLHGDEDLPERFERFHALVAGVPGIGPDLPAELLHFTYPDRYWLWTKWMWDPRNGTGALTLVTDDFDLRADGVGETYLKVGEAVAFVNETGKAAGFASAGEGLLGTDLFLACVYGVYMFTVLRMRMTNEFTKIVPELPELVRRLLGVHRMEV